MRRLVKRWLLGLATSANRPVVDAVISAAGLTHCFAATISGEEVARGKPAPDVYLEVLRKLDVSPRSSVAIEDSTNGLRAASAAGMALIAIPNREFPPADDALALADVVLESLDQLGPALVERF